MPIYEYKCLECGKISEYFISSNSKEKIVCKYCGSENVKKIFSSVVNVINSEASINRRKGKTCCGREERCSTPPCAEDGICKRV